jgi:hypothetical protein
MSRQSNQPSEDIKPLLSGLVVLPSVLAQLAGVATVLAPKEHAFGQGHLKLMRPAGIQSKFQDQFGVPELQLPARGDCSAHIGEFVRPSAIRHPLAAMEKAASLWVADQVFQPEHFKTESRDCQAKKRETYSPAIQDLFTDEAIISCRRRPYST